MIQFSENIPYAVQCSLWRRAQAVVGIHGGNLGCSMFLSPGQGLVEAGWSCKAPQVSMFGAATIHNGAAYRYAGENTAASETLQLTLYARAGARR
jgi:hypothetical protein